MSNTPLGRTTKASICVAYADRAFFLALQFFTYNSTENEIIAVENGHRLLENGLVVSAIFHTRSKSKKLCRHMNIELSNTEILKNNLTF